MTTKTNTFSFAGLELRCVTIEDQPWFVAADVCSVLGFREHPAGGFNNHLRGLSETDRRVLRKAHTKNLLSLFPGRTVTVSVISEPGLYTLVMRAQKANPKAREFQTWVTNTVLERPSVTRSARADAGFVFCRKGLPH